LKQLALILLAVWVILALLLVPLALAERGEWITVRCGGRDIMFNAKAYPSGISLTEKEICQCSRKRWRGLECDLQRRAKQWRERTKKVNEDLIDIIQGKK